jgi:hypothetical protein
MRIGSHVRVIHELQNWDDYRLLWDDPPDFASIYRKNHVGRFKFTDTGIVLEQRYILDGPLHTRTPWIKVLCSGGIGWMKRCDLELVE